MKNSNEHQKRKKDQEDENQSSTSGSTTSSSSTHSSDSTGSSGKKGLSKSSEQNLKKENAIIEVLVNYLKFIRTLSNGESKPEEIKAHIEELRNQVKTVENTFLKEVSEIKTELKEIERHVDERLVSRRRDESRIKEMRSKRSTAEVLSKRDHERKLFNSKQSSKAAMENVEQYLKRIPTKVMDNLRKKGAGAALDDDAKKILSSDEMQKYGKRMLEAIQKSRDSAKKLYDEKEVLSYREKDLASKTSLSAEESGIMRVLPDRISDIDEELERKRKEEEEKELAEKEEMALKLAEMQAKLLKDKEEHDKDAKRSKGELNNFLKLLERLSDKLSDPALRQEAKDIGNVMRESLSEAFANLKKSLFNVQRRARREIPKQK